MGITEGFVTAEAFARAFGFSDAATAVAAANRPQRATFVLSFMIILLWRGGTPLSPHGQTDRRKHKVIFRGCTIFRTGAGTMAQDGELARLLQSWSGGDREALAELVPLVYKELRS